MRTVQAIIQSRVEGFEPQATIRAVLQQNAGKLLTEHTLKKIKAACKRNDIDISRR